MFCIDRTSHTHTQLAAQRGDDRQTHAVQTLTADTLLAGIQYVRVYSYIEQLALLHVLPDLLRADPNLRLVVVDSIAFHFRHLADFVTASHRARLLSAVAQGLAQLAQTHKVAVGVFVCVVVFVCLAANGDTMCAFGIVFVVIWLLFSLCVSDMCRVCVRRLC